MHNGDFLARTRKNVAQDRSALAVHEDLSNGFDEVDGEPLGNGLCKDVGLKNSIPVYSLVTEEVQCFRKP
ncbi:MAG: hypothetical protein LBT70_03525 [Holosporaceae bacterium]|nr:hypothetical protein [Holosporaceae bacterium]